MASEKNAPGKTAFQYNSLQKPAIDLLVQRNPSQKHIQRSKIYIRSRVTGFWNFLKQRDFRLPASQPACLTTRTDLPPKPLRILPPFFLTEKIISVRSNLSGSDLDSFAAPWCLVCLLSSSFLVRVEQKGVNRIWLLLLRHAIIWLLHVIYYCRNTWMLKFVLKRCKMLWRRKHWAPPNTVSSK